MSANCIEEQQTAWTHVIYALKIVWNAATEPPVLSAEQATVFRDSVAKSTASNATITQRLVNLTASQQDPAITTATERLLVLKQIQFACPLIFETTREPTLACSAIILDPTASSEIFGITFAFVPACLTVLRVNRQKLAQLA